MTIDTQRISRVDDFFGEHRLVLTRQGGVVVSWRVRAGKRLGPYYRLEIRLPAGRKASVYLGPDGPLVADVRQRLSELRRPLRQDRQIEKLYRHLRRGARAARMSLAAHLKEIGLYLKGSEIRGRGRGTLKYFLASAQAGPAPKKLTPGKVKKCRPTRNATDPLIPLQRTSKCISYPRQT